MESIHEVVTGIVKDLEAYSQALKSFQRQLFLKGNDLLKSSCLARVETAFASLRQKHASFLNCYSLPDLLNLTLEAEILALPCYEELHICSVAGYSPTDFETCKLTTNRDKFFFGEFETCSGFLQRVSEVERADIGHLYSVDYFRPKAPIFTGRFGATICNNYDDVVTKIQNLPQKLLNVKVYRGYQMYFPGDSQPVFVVRDGTEVIKVGHRFMSESVEGLLNSSKCVRAKGRFVYFFSTSYHIVEVDWAVVETSILRGKPMVPGRKVACCRDVCELDFFSDSGLVFLTTTGLLCTTDTAEAPAVTDRLLEMHNASPNVCYTALCSGARNLLVAAYNKETKANSIFHLRINGSEAKDFLFASGRDLHASLNKSRQLSSQIKVRQLLYLKPRVHSSKGTFFLAVCNFDLVCLFDVSNGLALLEEQSITEDESTQLNGSIYLEAESKVFVFGDFNFQQKFKLKV